MKSYFLVLALVALPGAAVWPQEKSKDPPPAKQDEKSKPDDKAGKKQEELSPVEKFKAAKKEMDAARAEVNKMVAALRERKEQVSLENKEFKAVYDVYLKATETARGLAKDAAKADPKSDAGFDAISFMMSGGPPNKDALYLLEEHHAERKGISRSLMMLVYGGPSKEAQSLLEKVIAKNPEKADQAQARFILANMIKKSDEDKSIKMFEDIAKEFKDSDNKELKSIAGRSEGTLFEMRNLAIGKPVPDIEGEDTDGVKFKLSDYKGKVIMLDFWGHW